MSKIRKFAADGAASGEIEIADEALTLSQGDQAVKDVVVATMAARRAGSASTLGKGEVSGTNRKPWRQKGTGRARAGFTRSPVWVGGGVAMGPKPRDYSVKVNKKVARLAFRHALSSQIAEGKVIVLNAIPDDGKTKTAAAMLKAAGAAGRILVVTGKPEDKFFLAIRNIDKVAYATAANVDVYSLLAAKTIVVTADGLEQLKARMGKTEVAE